MARLLKPKILYLEIDEEITSVVDRMKSIRNKYVILVIPVRALVLQSIVNLKLLKKQSEKLDKHIALVTVDKNGRNLASQIGITVYSSIEERKDPEVFENTQVDDVASNNFSVEEKTTKKSMVNTQAILAKSKKLRERIGLIKQEKIHIVQTKELEKFSQKSIPTKSLDKKQLKNEALPKGLRYRSDSVDIRQYKAASPNRSLLYLLLGMSGVVLLFVAYYLLPNATIEIQPKLEPISYTTNISMLDVNRYSNVLNDSSTINAVASYAIEVKEYTLSDKAQVTGKRFIGSRARGTVEVVNKTRRTWQFVPNTRFQSPEGYVFRSETAINLGPNATLSVGVIADEYDGGGQPLGMRGNLQPTTFIVPGLGGLSPKFVEGRSTLPFSGGNDAFESVVSPGDIEAARQLIVEKVLEIAEDTLNDTIKEVNETNNLNLKLFKTGNDDSDIYTEILDVIVDQSIIDTQMTEFPIAAKVRMVGIAYDHEQMISIMKQGLSESILDNRNLVNIDDRLGFRVIENVPGEQRIKVETSLKGVAQYRIDARFEDRIRGQVVGKKVEEIEELFDTLPEVGQAKLVSWPFQLHRMPSIKANIHVKQME